MVTGRTVTPAEAHELGIVDTLFPADQLEGETLEYARDARQRARRRRSATSSSPSTKASTTGSTRGLERERELVEELFLSEDGREGIAAFAEKRQPAFTAA